MCLWGVIIRKKEEIFFFFYLFGWKQEFNRVRGIPRTCHFWQSHDAKACAPGERNNSVVIPREAAARRGRFLPQITALQLTLDQIRRSSSFSMKQEKKKLLQWVEDDRRRFSSCAAPLLSVAPPPALSVLSGWINGCVYKERRGEGEREGGRERGEDASS